MNQGKYLFGAIVGIAFLVTRSEIFGADAVTSGLGFLLLVLCLWPTWAWFNSGMLHLPLFEVYSFIHLIFYWIPAGKAGSEVLDLTVPERATALGVVCLYLACGQLAYFALLRQVRTRRTTGWRFWSNRLPFMRERRLPWVLMYVALGYNLAFQSGVIWDFVPGSLLPFVRALAGVCGLLGVFVLGRLAEEGRLTKIQIALFMASVAIITLVSYSSGYLGVGTVFVGNAFFAYTIGARKLPVLTLTAFLLFLSFLNYGKGEMRIKYWLMEEPTNNLVEVYSFWLRSSWEQFNTPADRREASALSAIDRANLTQVYVRIIAQTPHPLPYLNGQTYLDSLQLFIPRILWPERPDLNTIMNELGFRYGIHQTRESTQDTNISLGQIGEAWANGGWLAVAMAGAFFGCLFHIGVRTAYGRGTDTVGFLFGMTFVGVTVNVEQLAGTVLMIYYQSAVTCLFLLGVFSRPAMPPGAAPSFPGLGQNRPEVVSTTAK